MTRRNLVGASITALVLAAYGGAAYGDPVAIPPPTTTGGFLHMRSPSTLHTDGGSDLRLPPGYFMDEPTYDKLDAETKRLQDAETRLTVENKSMRKSLDGWTPGWYTIAGVALTSLAAGWYIHSKI